MLKKKPLRIRAAIAALQAIESRYGDVVVLFDCPTCRVSFEPDLVVPEVTPTVRIPAARDPKE